MPERGREVGREGIEGTTQREFPVLLGREFHQDST